MFMILLVLVTWLLPSGGGDSLLDPAALSEYLGIPIGTIYQWRHRGRGPRSIRVGRHLRYRLADVEAWLDSQTDRKAG